jgi:hypothetical protein
MGTGNQKHRDAFGAFFIFVPTPCGRLPHSVWQSPAQIYTDQNQSITGLAVLKYDAHERYFERNRNSARITPCTR